MDRRRFLTVLGVATFAGCSGNDTEPIKNENTDTETDTKQSDGNGGDTTATESPTETDSPEPAGESDVRIGESSLERREGDYSTDVWVAATVMNQGDAPSGSVTLKVRWYDKDGNFLDDTRESLASIAADETWAAHVHALTTDSEKIADYKIEGEFEPTPPGVPDAVELLESSMSPGDREVTVEGRVKNGLDHELSYIEAHGKVYNDAGEVMGEGWTNQSDIPAGETWRFDVSWRGRHRVDQAASHSVVLRDTL